jgi:Type I phosphodiesterase / nucleotide pyrophosphatase/Tetratricopeptide repeat
MRTGARTPAVAALLVASTVAIAGCGDRTARSARVVLLGIDGLDPKVVDLLVSEGEMPVFERLRRDGAYAPLRSQRPLLSPVIWTTVATGKPPREHGIGHFTAIDRATGAMLPVTRRMRRVEALWNIASAAGRPVAVVGWWATWPPEPVNGWVVSDHQAYHFLFEKAAGLDGRNGTPVTHPPELEGEIRPLLQRPGDLTPESVGGFVDVSPQELARPFSFDDDLSHFKWALATARSYRDIGLWLWRRKRPALELVYIEGTDSASHLFGHLFRAAPLAGELGEQQRRFGGTVEAMYRFADRLVGQYLDALGSDATLIVMSDHGFELGALHDDPSRTRDMRRVSERFHRDEGILYLYGRGVKANAGLDRPGILDIAPTVVTLLGIPPGRDMPGRVLLEGLDGVVEPERVASHEPRSRAAGGDRGGADGGDDAESDAAILARLESLGYLGGERPSGETSRRETSPEGERILAAMAFEAGRYEEALAAYLRLAAAEPGDAALRTSVAGVLGALGRYDEAMLQLGTAVELDPLDGEAYHNRAVILERRGEVDAAVADYQRAVRYRPDYEPSREALLRLTGSATVDRPRTPAEVEAAPDYVLVYQYRSNVAYLMGDRAAAIAALERALELEPDNALFRVNLEGLRNDGASR